MTTSTSGASAIPDPGPATRAIRRAANAAAITVATYAVLWFATTQVRSIREASPFAEDPWDAVATYAAIFLPLVAGATWVRSLRHRGPDLPPPIARRILWGAGLAVGIVAIAVAADVQAIVVSPPTTTPIAGFVAVSAAATVVALALLLRAVTATLADAPGRAVPALLAPVDSVEPDVVDDLLALGADVGRRLGIGGPVGRAAAAIDAFFERSALSPRRHRYAFGLVLAVTAAIAFDTWLGIVEGGWVSATVPLVFAVLIGSGVLAIYLGTLVPLRLLRPPLDP